MSGWRERGVARRAFGPAWSCDPSRCEPAGSKEGIARQQDSVNLSAALELSAGAGL